MVTPSSRLLFLKDSRQQFGFEVSPMPGGDAPVQRECSRAHKEYLSRRPNARRLTQNLKCLLRHSEQINHLPLAEDGKTELSLVHFTHTNPSWRAPAEAETFIAALREQTRRNVCFANNTVLAEDNSLSSLGVGLNSMLMRPQMCAGAAESLFRSPNSPGGVGSCSMMTRISRAEGPLIPPHSAQRGLLNPSLGASLLSHAINDDHAPESTEYPITDMSLSTLCLHELHHRQLSRRGYSTAMGGRAWDRTQPEEINPRREERTPLLVHPSTSQRL